MPNYELKAKARELTGKKIKKVREQDLIPAVLYGSEIENKNIAVNKTEFKKVYDQAGSSSLINLQIDEAQPFKILVQDLQLNPLTDEIIHIDFYKIQEGKKMTAVKELEFIGEAPAVKEIGGILVKNYDEVEVECLPKDLDLIDTLKVDLTVLKDFNDSIHIRDLKIPEEIKIMENPDEVIVMVSQPKEEKVEEKSASVEGAEGAEVGEEKQADAEGAEEKAEEKSEK